MGSRFARSLVALGLAAQAAFGQGPAQPPVPDLALDGIEIAGGSKDDRAYSEAAMGLLVGDPVGQESFQAALNAIRATDRFRTVEGTMEAGPSGRVAKIRLDPWPEIKGREFRGNLPGKLEDGLFTGMHKGGRAGELRLQRWQAEAVQRLKEAGYPDPSVRILREEGGAHLVIQVDTGAPALVRAFQAEGAEGLYSLDRLQGITGLRPGKTLWSEAAQRQAFIDLRARLVKDKRYEGTAEFRWDPETGLVALKVQPGPIVHLKQEGNWSFLWKDLEELVPLARAGSYSPELLDEGDRRILGFLRDKGYLDAKVSHRREVLRGSAERPEEVDITYQVETGERITIDEIVFERNKEVSEAELNKVAALPSGVWSLGNPPATPDLISAIETRIKNHYWSLGYPDIALRRPPMDRSGGKTKLVFQVREGTRQMVRQLVMDMPADPSWKPWALAEAMPLILADHPRGEAGSSEDTRLYRSDRSATEDVTATLATSTDPARPGVRTFTLTTSRPLPFVKNDLAVVFADLRQKIASLGVQRPLPRLRLDPAEGGYVIRFEVPDQPRLAVNRIVVQGADTTRAKAVLRETELAKGAPLDANQLSKAQTNLGNLGAFQRTDLVPLGESPTESEGLPAKEGDLLLKADERRPWVLSSAFGYDKSHGYHVGLGAQRLNFMGMGRSLDFGMRAGDNTFNNPTLRKWFPTGDFDRSVDSFTIGYTDPWFLPGLLKGVLQDRTQYRLEGAYIEETQSAFIAHRRRVLNSLDWKLGDSESLRLGHRYERTDIRANTEGIELSELFNMAGVPGATTVISAPYFQFIRDKRDNAYDPKTGTYFFGKLELANQLFGTGSKYSFAKLDVRQQWNWPIGEHAAYGVVMAAARIGLARPTAASVEDLPLAERFFAGGPYTVRGVEPDMLGPVGTLGVYSHSGGTSVRTGSRMIPLGGQGLVVLNLEYRFPLFGSETIWAEVFMDSGQVYARLSPGTREDGDPAPFPSLRTTLGLGLILKLGLPIKFEYATDLKRLLGRPLTQQEEDTKLKGLLISAGYQY